MIRNATPSDSGEYECQVSSEPKLSKSVNLLVQGDDDDNDNDNDDNDNDDNDDNDNDDNDNDDNENDDNDDNDDIYIMVKCLYVCLYVTKKLTFCIQGIWL